MKPSIRIYNRFLDLKGELDSYQSLQFGRSFHGVATFELHTNRYMHESQKIEKGDIISLDKSGKKAGIVESKEISLDQDGKVGENFIFKGTSLNGLMNRRQTVPPSHTGYDRITASAEEVFKHYVERNFISPDDHRRMMPNLEIAPTLNRGERVEWESRYKNVADELENISIRSGLGWYVYADFRNKKYIFDVLESYDLTQGNPDGYNPVFFSPEFETVKSQEFIDSDQELRNFGYVGGEGEGAERKIISVGDAVGWDRRESFIDARDINGNDEEENLTDEEVEQLLIVRGEQRLSETETIRALESEILTPGESSPFQYQRDFDLGDRVDIFNKSWSLKMSAPITAFLEVYEDTGFRIDATFGRAAPSFIQKVDNRFKRLEGTEQQEIPSQIAVENRQYTDRRVNDEEQERIRQAEENLKQSIRFTEDYAEKKRVESSEPPSDRSVVWVDTSDPDNVTWKIFSNETGEWVTAGRGPQGLPGPAGADGISLYTWLKYADDDQGRGLSDSPDGKKYMGLSYNNESHVESTNPRDYEWSKIEGEEGVPGPAGPDGEPRYTWVKYADNGSGQGMSDFPDGKDFIGLSYNQSTPTESNNPKDYVWSLIKGEKGDKGDRGERGIDGPPGADGNPTYTWIRYADTSEGSGMSAFPDGKKYIGLSPNQSSPTPTNNANDYEWSLIKGEDGQRGQQGIQGPRGADGNPTYTWVKYANNSSGSGMSDFPDGKTHIGLSYNKSTPNESNNASDYEWSLIKGDKGEKGDQGDRGIQGPRGENGQPTYTWIRYADNASGGGMSSSPNGKVYIGIAPNKDNPNPSSNPSFYEWSLIRGAQGATGQQGIPGPRGADGNPTYTWVKYANNASGGGMSDFPDGKTHIGLAYNKTTPNESNNANDYEWSLIKGDQGPRGPTGATGPRGNTGATGPQGPNVVDLNTVFGTGWFRVEHIQSLFGLNINDQFIVDNNGNVKLGGNNIMLTASGANAGINIREGAFTVEDQYSNQRYDIAPKSNLLLDHSFELMPINGAYSNTNNWFEIITSPHLLGSQWQIVGSPKVTSTFYPVDKRAQPIFGNKGVAVRNANYVRQYLQQSIGVGITYTLSAFWKRVWNATGGIPRIEVWHVGSDTTRKSRLFDQRFPAVRSDYNVRRESVTFTTPSNYVYGDALEIIFSGGDNNWVQVDGAQLVEASIPSLYNPEDSLWASLDATYWTINNMHRLWSGTVYPTNTQTATPVKPLRLCRNGWALEWRGYNIGEGWLDSDYSYTYIPKAILNAVGNSYCAHIARYRTTVYKFLYINGTDGTSLTGHRINNEGDNNRLALNAIYEW